MMREERLMLLGVILMSVLTTWGLAYEAEAQFVENIRIIHEVHAEATGDQFGWVARRVEDCDGDGITDFTTSAPTKSIGGQANVGRIYTYSGKTGELLWTADGSGAGAQLGIGIEGAGDVNADGIGDVIAGSPGTGRVFIYSGLDGTVLHELKSSPRLGFGRKVGPTGDVNQDGHDDVVIGAMLFSTDGGATGQVFIYSGRDGSVLRTFDGERAGDRFGSVVSGFSDKEHSFIVIGAMNAAEGNKGRVYVYDGRNGELKFTIEPDEKCFNLGRMFVSVVGDVDADGTPDVYATDWEHRARGRQTGRAWVYSGATGKQLYMWTGEAAGDGFGIGNGDAGDVNGDGHADVIVGAWQSRVGASGGGRVYLYSGKDGSLMTTYTCNVVNDTWGFDATNLGDVDGDGEIDLLITSAWSEVKHGKQAGRVFVISAAVGE